MAHNSITWDIRVGGLAYGRRDGIKPGDTQEIGDGITAEQAALKVAMNQAHWSGEKPPHRGQIGEVNAAYTDVVKAHNASVRASAR